MGNKNFNTEIRNSIIEKAKGGVVHFVIMGTVAEKILAGAAVAIWGYVGYKISKL